ncbi:MAG: response regulator [Candidatus Riflebacteria bacterium]|nr:response regulator [Candidatus Riflebacteria bacterium]
MGNFSIAQKLFLIAILTVITVFSLAYTSIQRLNISAFGFEELTDKSFPKITILSQLQQDLLEMIRFEKNALLTESDSEIRAFFRQMEGQINKIIVSTDAIYVLADEIEKTNVNKFREEFSLLQANQAELITLASAKSNSKANSLFKTEATEKLQGFERAIFSAIDLISMNSTDTISLVTQEGLEKTKKIISLFHDSHQLWHLLKSHIDCLDETLFFGIEKEIENLKKLVCATLAELMRTSPLKSAIYLADADSNFQNFLFSTNRILELSRNNSEQKAMLLSNTTRRQHYLECQKILSDFSLHLSNDFHNQRIQQNQSLKESEIRISITGVIGCSVILLLMFITFQSIVKPLNEMILTAENISRGKICQKVKIYKSDEIGSLSLAFNNMINSLQEIVQRTTDIAMGNYESRVNLRSSEDELGQAIIKMMESLVKFRNEALQKNWLEIAISNFMEKTRKIQDFEQLGNSALSVIAETIDAKIGAFHLLQPDQNFKMIASFAHDQHRAKDIITRPGEGLVGQAAIEKRPMLLKDLPKDYIFVQSGLGEAIPKFLIVLPCSHNEVVRCILEFGFFQEPTEVKLELLSRISENIAITVYDIQSRLALSSLFEEQKKQSYELNNQKEELRITNEQLAQHTIDLQQSEKVLKFQQEELQQTNDELLKGTQLLENKQKELEKRSEELEKANQAIRIKAEELESANKYKSEFLANVSHELRTPLNSLLILSQLLLENKEKNLQEKQLEFLKVINNSGKDLLVLIDDILDLTKVEAGKLLLNIAKVKIDELLTGIREVFFPLVQQKMLDFEIIQTPEIPESIVTDPKRVEQILNNLIGNAIKFTEKGKITVELKKSDQNPEMLAFSIKDTGIGISPDKKEFIFEAFHQVDASINRKYSGTGLGLTISRELASILGGKITLESELDKGSIFTLLIPLEIPKADYKKINLQLKSKDQTNIDPQQALNGSLQIVSPHINLPEVEKKIEVDQEFSGLMGADIMIVDDDQTFSSTLANMATERGLKVEIALSGKQAFEMISQSTPKAMILDCILPDMDARKFLSLLRSNKQTKDIPIIVYSEEILAKPDELYLKQFAESIIIKGPKSNERLLNKVALFFHRLKKNIGEKEPLNSASESEEEKIFQDKVILIVDDDMRNVFAASGIFERKGSKILIASNGKEALKILADKEVIDLVLMDIMMPEMDGFETINTIRQSMKFSKIPILVLSAKAMKSDKEKCLTAGANEYLTKPIEVDKLLSIARVWLS